MSKKMNSIKVIKKITYSHEKNGFYELDNIACSRIVNETGKDIIADINAGCDLPFLEEKYCGNGFSKNDLYNYLSDLRILGYINFSNDYFSELFIDYLTVAGDREFVKVSKAFENHLDRVIYPENIDAKYYNVMTMRTRAFSNKETIVFEEEDGEIGAIIGVRGFSSANSPLVINSLVFGKNGMDSLVAFYEKAEKFFISRGKRKVKMLFTGEEIRREVKEFLDRAGFKFEAKLECEDGDSDAVIYSRILKRIK